MPLTTGGGGGTARSGSMEFFRLFRVVILVAMAMVEARAMANHTGEELIVDELSMLLLMLLLFLCRST